MKIAKAYYLLVLVGCLSFTSRFFNIKPLEKASTLIASSPIMVNFSTFSVYEPFGAEYYLRLKKNNQIVYQNKITKKGMREIFEGIQDKNNVQELILYSAFLEETTELNYAKELLRKRFCHQDLFKENFTEGLNYNSVVLIAFSKSTRKLQQLNFEVQC